MVVCRTHGWNSWKTTSDPKFENYFNERQWITLSETIDCVADPTIMSPAVDNN